MSQVEQEKKPCSEDIINKKWDKTISDVMLRTGIGLGIGIVASTILFKRRAWPVVFFTGTGVGSAYAEAQRRFSCADEE